jgi:hypothetical protein
LAQGKTTIEVSGSAVPVSRPNAGRGIKGRVWEVLVLWGHSAAAAAWLAFIALFAALALPAARRRISEVGLYHLEERFDLLLKGTWTAAGLTVASGTYLLLKQTAYKTPFSPSAVHGVFALPYARPYFLALGTKLALYTLMIGASLPLIREARRQLCTGASTVTKSPSAPDPWAATPQAPATGRTLVAAAPPVVAAPARPASGRGPGRMGARLGALVVAGGGVGLWICVTLLKYFHELVEASRLR